MTASHLTIAKASFAASCMRPDVTKLNRDEINNFHSLLEVALTKCSPSNVQKCKKWLLENILPSPQRIGALGKYLATLAKHTSSDVGIQSGRTTTARRKRLHILYLIHDLVHHAKHHSEASNLVKTLVDGLQPHVADIFQHIITNWKVRVKRRLNELIQIWMREELFDTVQLKDIAQAIESGEAISITHTAPKPAGLVKELPYMMPSMHGDALTPYYDLPAANLMPHIIPNSATPMRPDRIKALQLPAGPVDQVLATAVKDFLKEANRLDDPYSALEQEGIVIDVDELGAVSHRNEDDEVVGNTYYGWSRNFCEKMKKRAGEKDSASQRSRSSSSGSRRSRSPAKRRRYDRSPNRSQSRSTSPYRDRSRSFSPSRKTFHSTKKQDSGNADQAPQASQRSVPNYSSFPPPLSSFPPLPIGPDGLPMLPPKPPNWVGLWPPPLPLAENTFSSVPYSPPPPPAPPPPPPF